MPTILSQQKEEVIQSIVRKFKLLPLLIVFLLLGFSLLFVRDLAQQSVFGTVSQKLPFPGVLPDNPLYPLKNMRDVLLVYTTRDSLKKAQLVQHLADKHMAAAGMVEKCGLSAQTAGRAQDELRVVRKSLEKSSSMGSEPEVGYIIKTERALSEHKVVLANIKKRCGSSTRLQNAMKENSAFSNWFSQTYSDQQ